MTWKEYLMTARGRYAALFCVVILSMMFGLMPAYYRDIITPKPSILLDDPILNLFTPIDWSTPVFFILTVAILQTVAFYIRTPSVLFLGLTTYCAINVVRMITIYAITLEQGLKRITDSVVKLDNNLNAILRGSLAIILAKI